jgi:hypothetical protein
MSLKPSFRRAGGAGLAGAITAAVTAASLAPAYAATYVLIVDTAKSEATADVSAGVPLVGTLIGNYDPVTNPDGTRTLPGLFGGSGNQPIPYTGNVTGGGPTASQPAGQFAIAIDADALACEVSDLAIDVLNGAQSVYPATLTLLYSTFRTFAPDSVFPGGVPVPLPLGDLVIGGLTLTQTGGPAAGSLSPLGPDEYEFAAIITASVAYSATFGGNPIDAAPFAIVLPVSGTISIGEDGATALVTFDVSGTEVDEGPFEPITNVPMDVPTVLPTGYIAHLLVSAQIQSVTLQYAFAADMTATGDLVDQPGIPGDLDGDGDVDVFDLLALLGVWGPCPDASDCPADLDGSGAVDVFDLLILLGNWG